MSKIRETESQLLSVYQKVNPSTYAIETDVGEYRARENFLISLIQKKLKLPRKMFDGTKLIEFGSGTGEHSLFFQKWGAQGTYVEINNKAINRMVSLFDHFGIERDHYRTIQRSIFDFESDCKYELVVTNGVLHHLEQKEQAFGTIASCLAPGGFLVLGIANSAGFFQRNLQRLIVRRLAGADETRTEQVAEQLFKEHLDRAQKYGRRSRKSIIYDTYCNPKIDTMSVTEVLELFHQHDLELYSAWPPLLPAILGDSANRPSPDLRNYPNLTSLSELVFLSHRDDDYAALNLIEHQLEAIGDGLKEITSAVDENIFEGDQDIGELKKTLSTVAISPRMLPNPYGPVATQAQTLLAEAIEILTLLEQDNITNIRQALYDCRYLFRGSAGIGMNYYVAERPTHPDRSPAR